jgi:hypothetical protein
MSLEEWLRYPAIAPLDPDNKANNRYGHAFLAANPEDFVADYEPPRCWLLSRDGQHVRFAGNLPRGGSLVGEAPATSVNLYHVCLYRRRETMQVLCQMPLCTQAGAKAR